MNKQFSKAIMSLAVFALSMNPVHSTHIGIKAGLQILLKAAAIKTNGRDYSPLFKSLGEKNKESALKTKINNSAEQMKRLSKIMSDANKVPNGAAAPAVGTGILAAFDGEINHAKNADLLEIVTDRAKGEAALAPAKEAMKIFDEFKKSSNGSYDNQADFVDRLRFVLGVNMLFDVSNDGFYKLGANARAHFFGNKKFIGDKNSNDFISVTNPFGFSFGLLGSIGMFHVGVNLAFDKLNADLKSTSSDLLGSIDNIISQSNSVANDSKALKTNLGLINAPALTPAITIAVTNTSANIDTANEIIDTFKKGYSNPFTNSNARIADGMYCSLQGIIGVEFPIFNQDLVSFYADLVINLPLTGVKGDNSLGHGVEFKRDVSFAIEAGIQVNL